MGEIADALRRSGTDQPSPNPGPRAADSPREFTAVRDELRAAALAAAEPQQAAPAKKILHLGQNTDGDHQLSPSRASLQDPTGLVSQQFLRIAFRLRDRAIHGGIRSIVMTSAEPFEGKTTTACNLAAQLAKLDHSARVALVDLDLRRAGVGRSLGISIECPIDAVIRGERQLDDAILDTDVEGLSILGLDHPAQHPEALFAAPGFRTMMSDLNTRFDFVIIDSPPVLAASDAQIILRSADAGLLVTRAGKTHLRTLRRALEYLPAEKLLGTVLNCTRSSPEIDRYGEYGHGGNSADALMAGPLEEDVNVQL